jgi:hypothetical protein
MSFVEFKKRRAILNSLQSEYLENEIAIETLSSKNLSGIDYREHIKDLIYLLNSWLFICQIPFND